VWAESLCSVLVRTTMTLAALCLALISSSAASVNAADQQSQASYRKQLAEARSAYFAGIDGSSEAAERAQQAFAFAKQNQAAAVARRWRRRASASRHSGRAANSAASTSVSGSGVITPGFTIHQ
jgi:hypothetical protein